MSKPAHSPTEALLALGGNIGDVRETFDRAIAMLGAEGAVRFIARSSDYRTPPWGVADQPPFINAAIIVVTSLDPRALLTRALAVERALGRAPVDRGQDEAGDDEDHQHPGRCREEQPGGKRVAAHAR